MKKLTFLLVAISMVASYSLSAADDAAPKKKREIPAEILKKYDKDNDGKLSKEERAEMRKDRENKAKPAK
jgi:hypothetical protein